MKKIEIGEYKKKDITIYIILRVLVIATMIIQLLRGNFENVFMCVLTLILFLIPIFIDRKLNIKLPDECWIENSSIYLNLNKDTLLINFKIVNKKIVISKNKMEETLSKHKKVSWQEEISKNKDRLLNLEANSIKKTVDFIKKINK